MASYEMFYREVNKYDHIYHPTWKILTVVPWLLRGIVWENQTVWGVGVKCHGWFLCSMMNDDFHHLRFLWHFVRNVNNQILSIFLKNESGYFHPLPKNPVQCHLTQANPWIKYGMKYEYKIYQCCNTKLEAPTFVLIKCTNFSMHCTCDF